MSEYFKVVHVHQTNDIEPVPHLWEQDGVLYWPTSKHIVRKFQSNGASKPDKSTWKKYSCTVKEDNIVLFMHASQSCERYFNTSEESASISQSSEDEDSKKGQKYCFGSKISMSNRSKAKKREETPKKKPVVKKAAVSVPSKQVCVKTSVETIKKKTYAPSDPTSSAVSDDLLLNATNKNAGQSLGVSVRTPRKNIFASSKVASERTPRKNIFASKVATEDLDETLKNENALDLYEIFNFLKKWKEEEMKKLTDFGLRLDRMEEKLQQLSDSSSNIIPELPCENTSQFPISSKIELKKFEKDLNDDNFKKLVFSHLTRIIGTGVMGSKAACYKLSNVMFTKELLTQYSWTGMSRNQTKDSFQKLKNTLALFYKLVYKTDSNFSYAKRDEFFRDRILKHSSTRFNQPWKKKNAKKTGKGKGSGEESFECHKEMENGEKTEAENENSEDSGESEEIENDEPESDSLESYSDDVSVVVHLNEDDLGF